MKCNLYLSIGWPDTIAFLSLPLILYISQVYILFNTESSSIFFFFCQSLSQKILQPPKDPNKVLTEQELFSQVPMLYKYFLLLNWKLNNDAVYSFVLFYFGYYLYHFDVSFLFHLNKYSSLCTNNIKYVNIKICLLIRDWSIIYLLWLLFLVLMCQV